MSKNAECSQIPESAAQLTALTVGVFCVQQQTRQSITLSPLKKGRHHTFIPNFAI